MLDGDGLPVREPDAAERHHRLAVASRSSTASACHAGRTCLRRSRGRGARPWRRISREKLIRQSARRCDWGSATKQPRPGSRTTRPSSASRSIALRAVIRLTPNSAHRSASDGSRSPGRRVAMRSRSACSISR